MKIYKVIDETTKVETSFDAENFADAVVEARRIVGLRYVIRIEGEGDNGQSLVDFAHLTLT